MLTPARGGRVKFKLVEKGIFEGNVGVFEGSDRQVKFKLVEKERIEEGVNKGL